MLARETFAQHVKDALETYYDPVRLRSNPLADLLRPPLDYGENKLVALRLLLRETIESLRPPPSISFGRPEYLGYRLLWLKCIQSRSQQAICDELALSRTSYYRHLHEALDAVITILWDRYAAQVSAEQAGSEAISSTDQAIERVGQLARQGQRQVISLAKILDHVRQTIAPIEANLGISVRISSGPVLPQVYGDPAILGQIVLNILTEAMSLARDRTLELTIALSGREMIWSLYGLDRRKVSEQSIELLSGFAISRSLLGAYHGRLWVDRDSRQDPILHVSLPSSHLQTIVIVDDDPDTVELYRRYLQSTDYIIQVAHTAGQVEEILAHGLPDLILLDVIMPQQDGWDVLQSLKTRPETAHIPIIICSVLSQPLLALMLGAAEVLQKPVERNALLQAIKNSLHHADTAG